MALNSYSFYWYDSSSSDYYYGNAYDDGRYGYYSGQTLTAAKGSYYIYGVTTATGSHNAGDVVTASTYHDGQSGHDLKAYYGASGATAGYSGIGSEYDYATLSNGSYAVYNGKSGTEVNDSSKAYSFYWSDSTTGDYYYGTAYDNGKYGYSTGQTLTAAKGSYYIYGVATATGSHNAGDVVTASTYHDGQSGHDLKAYYGASGATAGTNGIGSEYDYATLSDGSYAAYNGKSGIEVNDSSKAYSFYWSDSTTGDYYYGTAYDDGKYGYSTGQTLTAAKGSYYIYGVTTATGSHNSGDVVTASTYHDGQSGQNLKAYYGASGATAGTKGIGSEYDYATLSNGNYATYNGKSGTEVDEHFNSVFRFYDKLTDDHFYTSSVVEKNSLIATNPNFQYEGAQWSTPDKGANTIDVFRFYDTLHGTHFLTTSVGERNSIIANQPTYNYEGVAFQAYKDATTAGTGGLTLERFYNTATGNHHYSASAGETYGINHGSAGANWVDEGSGFTVHVSIDGMLHV